MKVPKNIEQIVFLTIHPESDQLLRLDEFEAKQKEFEGVVNPIMLKVYQASRESSKNIEEIVFLTMHPESEQLLRLARVGDFCTGLSVQVCN